MKTRKYFSKEVLLVGAVIFAAIFLAKFPTIYNWLNTPKGYWYPGQTSWFDAWDINFQVSYIRYGERHGANLINTYTTIPHKGVFIYQYYTFLGILNRLIHLDPFLLFQISSLVTAIVFLLVLYYVLGIFLRDFFARFCAFAVISLGAGLGWIKQFGLSCDANLAGFTPLYAMERGHEALISLLLLLCFAFIFRFLTSSKKKYLYAFLVCGFLSFTIHPPFALLIILIVSATGVFDYIKNHDSKFLPSPFVLGISYLVYFTLVYTKLLDNPGFSGVVGQNLFSMDALMLVLGFGLWSLPIFWMLVFDRQDKNEVSFLKLLFITQLLLLFLPLGFHLYFAKNLFVWGVVLGFFGIRSMVKKEKTQKQIILFLVIASMVGRINIFNTLLNPDKTNSFFFLTLPEGKALEELSKLPADGGVLSLYRIGNYIPAFTDLKVYYGHNYQTPESSDKKEKALSFFGKMDEKERRRFLKENNISYIFYGLEENLARNNQEFSNKNPFEEYKIIYQNNAVTIYLGN